MAKQTMNRGTKNRKRVKVGKLPKQAAELSKAEQKEVKGGVMKASADTQNNLAQALKA